MSVPPEVWVGSNTADSTLPSEKNGSLPCTSTRIVKLVPPVILNSRWIAPLPLSAGVPPVDTTVAEPEVSVSTSLLLTVCPPLIASGMLDELVYVMEDAVELE